MVYAPTVTIEINQMQVYIYLYHNHMDGMGFYALKFTWWIFVHFGIDETTSLKNYSIYALED